MRPVSEWTIEDLRDLIRDGVQEGHSLDYKQSAALARSEGSRKELSKDVSAFANSSGGILVYGMVEKDHLPLRLDDGIVADITREWIEQTIDGNVRPRIAGLVIKLIDGGEGQRYLAIDVPQATVHAPHQANDLRYYRRGNFKSEPMYDYEVRDILRRASSPELFLELKLFPRNQGQRGISFGLEIYVGNRSAETALYSHVRVQFERGIEISGPAPQWTCHKREVADSPGNLRSVYQIDRLLSVPDHPPLYREVQWFLGDFEVCMDGMGPHHFHVELTCPGFATAEDYVFIYTGRGKCPIIVQRAPADAGLEYLPPSGR